MDLIIFDHDIELCWTHPVPFQKLIYVEQTVSNLQIEERMYVKKINFLFMAPDRILYCSVWIERGKKSNRFSIMEFFSIVQNSSLFHILIYNDQVFYLLIIA